MEGRKRPSTSQARRLLLHLFFFLTLEQFVLLQVLALPVTECKQSSHFLPLFSLRLCRVPNHRPYTNFQTEGLLRFALQVCLCDSYSLATLAECFLTKFSTQCAKNSLTLFCAWEILETFITCASFS